MFYFHKTGDDGSSEEPQQGVLVKESESLYTLWCTGRAGCDGLLVEIKVSQKVMFIYMSKTVKRISDDLSAMYVTGLSLSILVTEAS